MPAGDDIELELATVIAATSGKLLCTGADRFSSVGIDSRTARPGMLFFAVKGERFDGHDFASAAQAAGAAGVVAARGRGAPIPAAASAGVTLFQVDAPVGALGPRAPPHRAALPALRLVGVAGSNGKTTTKEIVASILTSACGAAQVLKTDG